MYVGDGAAKQFFIEKSISSMVFFCIWNALFTFYISNSSQLTSIFFYFREASEN